VFGFRRGGKVERSESLIALDLVNAPNAPNFSTPVQCRLRLSNRRRTLALRVSANGEVVVNAPLRLAKSEIEQFLRKHADWISDRLHAFSADRFVWQHDAALPYLGSLLRLHLVEGAGASVQRQADQLICAASHAESPARLAALVQRWYQREARALLHERLTHHAARAGIALPVMRLSNARTRWGSLSGKGVVSLNWRLIKASLEEIDYVICHELAHFRQRNHSPAFWREVGNLFPDYLRVREKLRRAGSGYFAF
jgi:predicted metal-dependent hydrolase